MPRILIADAMSPRAAEIFRARGLEVDTLTDLSAADLATRLSTGGYDGLAVRSSTKVTADTLNALGSQPHLKVIGRAGIGVDTIDVPAATAAGIVVMNTPFGNSITTAEHAVAMMMALARQIPQADRSTQAGKWEKSRFMGVEFFGKTLGIIGCGNIGSIVANRAQGLKMKVLAFDPFLTDQRARDLGVEKLSLDELLARADFISLHTPLTDSTKNILDAKALEKTRRGVYVINCARGGLLDETALRTALDAGHVAGAALDVFAVEPARDNPLFGHPNVICTPHLGASTREAQENVAIQIAEQMADYLTTGAVVNAVNTPAVSAEDAPKLRPYMKLAEQLGSVVGQTATFPPERITVDYEGPVAALNVGPLTALVLMGLLSATMDSVNMVNAPHVAKQRNIRLAESRTENATDYHTLIRVTAQSGDRRASVAGTLFGGDKPRIVAIDDVQIEAELTARMLFTRNLDKPGMIGKLGATLGAQNINISHFHLGRTPQGDTAIALISVDGEMPSDLAKHVAAIENVLEAKLLRFGG